MYFLIISDYSIGHFYLKNKYLRKNLISGVFTIPPVPPNGKNADKFCFGKHVRQAGYLSLDSINRAN